MSFTDTFKEGNVQDIMAPKLQNVRRGKTLVLIPKVDEVTAMNEGVIGRVLGCDTTDQYKYIVIKEHYVYDPTITFQNKKKYVPCLGQGCPLCAAGSKPNERFGFMFEHFNSVEKSPNGAQVNFPKRKILLVGSTVAKQLYIKHKMKPLSSQVFLLAAVAGKTPTYIVESRGDYTNPVQCDTNELNDFNILRPSQLDAEEARRLAQFVNAGGAGRQDSFGPPPQNFGAAPVTQNYGVAPTNQGYGAAPVAQQYAAPTVQQNYGTAPVAQNYGIAPVQNQAPVIQAPVQQNYGVSPQQTGNPYTQPAAGQQQTAPYTTIPDPWANVGQDPVNPDASFGAPNVVAGTQMFDPKEQSATVDFDKDDIPF